MLNFLRFFRQRAILTICLMVMIFVFLHRSKFVGCVISFYYYTGIKTLPLSIRCNKGRLGNQMCTYASLYGLSALNRRPFISLTCNFRYLKPHFKGLKFRRSINEYLYMPWNSWSIIPYLRPEDATIPATSNFINGYQYPCSYTFFDHVQDEIRDEFQFSDELQQYAYKVLQKANVNHTDNVTFVGVHVRRGDYQAHWLNSFGGIAVNMEYFKTATEYFRNKYHPVIFILVSDDRVWCIENLAGHFGFYVTEEPSTPAHDLSVLASCNHTIMTYGTFGFWGAYLAGGEVLYFDKFLKPNTSFTRNKFIFEKMYPPRWKGIVTINASVFDNVTFVE